MTVAYRLAMMRVLGYDLMLDLVVVTPDDRLAAFCSVSIHEAKNTL